MNHLSDEAKRIIDQTYSKPAPLTAETVTIGCEFEFILAEDTTDGSESSRRKGQKAICDALKQPCTMTCSDPKCPKTPAGKKFNEFTWTLPVVVKDGENDNWVVGSDHTVEPPGTVLNEWTNRDMVTLHGIEIRSRVMQFSRGPKRAAESGEHICWITFQEEIKHVCNVLEREFGICREDSVGSKYHIFPTSKSGFHCHVGNGLGTPISFATAKRLLSVFVACERHLDRLVGTRDITGSSLVTKEIARPLSSRSDMSHLIDDTSYNKPFSVYFIMGAHLRRQRDAAKDSKVEISTFETKPETFTEFYPQTVSSPMAVNPLDEAKYGYDIDSWLNLVNNADDIRQFRDLDFQQDKKCTLNLMHLAERRAPESGLFKQDVTKAKLTIEFRQHAGTLLAAEAISFIELVVAMVLRCHKAGEEEFCELLEPEVGLRETSFTAKKFLAWAKCSKPAVDFYINHLTGNKSALVQQLKIQEKFLTKHGDDMPMAKFALEEIGKHLRSIDPQNVEARIARKLETGGYGQFRPEVLRELLKAVSSKASEETRERLTIGYQIPVKIKTDDKNKSKTKGEVSSKSSGSKKVHG